MPNQPMTALVIALLAPAALASGAHHDHATLLFDPLGHAPYVDAGARDVGDIPFLPTSFNRSTPPGPKNRAVVYYPLLPRSRGAVAPGHFPVIVIGHAKRYPSPPGATSLALFRTHSAMVSLA